MATNDKVILVDSSSNCVTNITNLCIPGLKTEGLLSNVASITTTYTITGSDDVIIGSNASSEITMILPAASGSGKVYYIKNIGAANVIVDANVNGATIDTELTQTINQWGNITIVDGDSDNYYIL